jgi:hypothetical protein
MTNPTFRATPQQWAQIEHTAEDIHSDGCCALLELRARVELLEATQHAHIDTSRLSDEKRDQIRQDLAPIVMPSPPAGLLVERVAQLIANFASEGLPSDDATPTARAAILEVAAWLREHTLYSATSKIAADLEYEANR